MSEHLPTTDPDLITQLQNEYDSVFQSGSRDEVDAARYRMVWALVHSAHHIHVQRGLNIARAEVDQKAADKKGTVKEYRYFMAVAYHKLGQNIAARRELTALLEDHPEFRQAEFLRGLVEDGILKDGMVGVGVVGIASVVVGVGLAVLFGGRRR